MKAYKSEAKGKRILETYDALIKAWGVPVEARDVQTRYGATHVNVFGKADGKPIVLFHGVGDDAALMWVYNAKSLAPHFRLYAVDTIGGPGRSVPGPGYDKTFDDVTWIDEVADGLGLARFDIAGVSHGGYLAQLYAVKRPERAGKIACLSAGVPAGKGSPMKAMLKIFLPEAIFPTERNIRKLLRKLSGDNSAAFTDNPLVLAHFTALLKGFNNMAMGYHKVLSFPDAEIDTLRGRALYLAGEADPFMLIGGKEKMESYHMNTRMFPKVGHGINHEIPKVIDDILIEYFKA